MYALYQSYDFTQVQISRLFIWGFGSSMIFGTFVGALSDKLGRRSACQGFCVIYALSCFTKHSRSYDVLLFGRILGGIATSLLFSTFEAWLLSENSERQFTDDHLKTTFSNANFGNGIIAILAGVLGNAMVSLFGYVGAFDLSAIILLVDLFVISSWWTENYGNQSVEVKKLFQDAVEEMKNDKKILVVGCIQSCFESAMYLFVFM